MSLLLITLLACDRDGTVKTGADDSGDTGSAWWEENTDPDAPPVIESGTVSCEPGSNSSGDLFFVTIKVTDPNGNDSLDQEASTIELKNVFEESFLVCDGGPQCEGSWRTGDYGSPDCAQGSGLDVTAVIVDRDGNSSDEFELTWN